MRVRQKSLFCHLGFKPGSHPTLIINAYHKMTDQVRHDKTEF